MNVLKVWFPEYFTEAHRKEGEGAVLAEELRQFGIECQLELDESCNFIFCGSIWKADDVNKERKRFPNTPVIHYNWDLYPFQIVEREDYKRPNPGIWIPYLEDLKSCRDIWVPSACTIDRTREFVKRGATVIKSSVRVWNASHVYNGNYIVDVMRKYPDFNEHEASISCKVLGLPIVETRNNLSWEEFKAVIAGSKFLVSAQYEASTGGLTLIEGLWHGKPSLISNSPRHGGVDYLGPWASYFQWDNPILFREALKKMYYNTPQIDIGRVREWITENYSERAMAKRMADRFWELYNESN